MTTPSLIRDETAGALSPSNCRAYIKMLRLAAELIGADKVLFVSHQEEMNESADSRIVIADGTITIA